MLPERTDKSPGGIQETALARIRYVAGQRARRPSQAEISPLVSDRSPLEPQKSSFVSLKSAFWAGLASLGLHGLGLTLLPYISNFGTPKTSQSPSPIKVVELTPSELSRIPALIPSPKPTNPLPTEFYQAVLPVPPKANRPSSSLPPLPSLSPLVVASPPLQPSPSPSPYRSIVTSLPPTPPSGLTVTSLPPAPSPSLAGSPSPLTSPPLPGEASPPPPPLASASAPVALPSFVPPVAGVETNLENPTDETLDPKVDSATNLRSEDKDTEVTRLVDDNSPEFSFNSSNTKEEDAKTNYQNWASRLEISANKVKKVSLKENYPDIACRKKLSGEVVVAISIDNDRQPNSPEIIKSSGYQVLDEQAIADTMSASFDKAAIGQPYLVTLKYQYRRGNC